MKTENKIIMGTWALALVLVGWQSLGGGQGLPQPRRLLGINSAWSILGVMAAFGSGFEKMGGAIGVGLDMALLLAVFKNPPNASANAVPPGSTGFLLPPGSNIGVPPTGPGSTSVGKGTPIAPGPIGVPPTGPGSLSTGAGTSIGSGSIISYITSPLIGLGTWIISV
jgi:hypothetical protein